MADLLFAASAADDAQATRLIAQTCADTVETPCHEEHGEFETVDDLEVAASAATAAQWSLFQDPLPSVSKHPRQRPSEFSEERMECSTDSEECSSKSDSEFSEGDPMSGIQSAQVQYPVSVALEYDDRMMDKEETNFVRLNLVLNIEPTETETSCHEECATTNVACETQPSTNESLDVEMEERIEDAECIQLTEGDELRIVGAVENRIGDQLVIQAGSFVRPLDSGTVLFTLNGQLVGKVADIFGCVEEPHYLVDIARKSKEQLSTGTKVYSTDRLSVFFDLPSNEKGRDVSDGEQTESENDSEEEMLDVDSRRTSFRSEPPATAVQRRKPRTPRNPRRRSSQQRHPRRERWQAMEQQTPIYSPPPQPTAPPAAVPTFIPQPSYLPSFTLAPYPFTVPQITFHSFQGSPFPGFHPYNILTLPPQPSPPVSESPQPPFPRSQHPPS